MQFVNPIELLKIQGVSGLEINSTLIKKQKRQLIADIELSDNNSYNYYNIQLTKSDCEKAIDELEDRDKAEFYLHLSGNNELSMFLIKGDFISLKSLKSESIYSLEKFIDFVSPFFAENYNRLLSELFTGNDLSNFQLALKAPFLVSKYDVTKAYRGITQEIDSRIIFIDKITDDIKEERSSFSDGNIDNILEIINQKFPIQYLNSLPSFFQSSINKIAKSLNFLQLNIWNEFNTTLVPKLILEHLLKLNIESVSKPTFEKNYSIVKKKHEERLEQERNAPLLSKWAKILLDLQRKAKEVEDSQSKAQSGLTFVQNNLDIEALNSLPSFADEIRVQIAYAIRGMAISAWNEQNDLANSLQILILAKKITVNKETSEKLNKDHKDLLLIEAKRKIQGKPISSAPSLRTINGVGTTIYGDTHYFVILAIPIIPLGRYNCEPTYNGYRFYGKLELHPWQKVWQYLAIGAIAIFFLSILLDS